MSSPVRSHFGTEELKHLLFNFHRPAELQDIEAVLSLPPERAPALLVTGEGGIGRRYMVQSAVLSRQQAGVSIRYAGIDLEGFEPGQSQSDFANYLGHLGSKHQWGETERWRELTKWVGESKIKLTLRTAALVSVAFESSLSGGFNPRAHAGRDGSFAARPAPLCVSIHAPTRGATCLCDPAPAVTQFQSTRPRGARRCRAQAVADGPRFNPRAHAGRDVRHRRAAPAAHVSIHAPTRGATSPGPPGFTGSCFNPRAHAGRDGVQLADAVQLGGFNPRAHAGRDAVSAFALDE